jgi:hypothetical protein
MPAEARANLGTMQFDLVAALVDEQSPPSGFDAGRVQIAAQSLRNKRERAVARAWPGLRGQIEEHFAAFASETPLPREGGPFADGWAFAEWLARRTELPDAARLHLLAAEMRHVRTRDALFPRDGLCIRLVRLRVSRRLVIAIRLPLLGEHWFSAPWQ